MSLFISLVKASYWFVSIIDCNLCEWENPHSIATCCCFYWNIATETINDIMTTITRTQQCIELNTVAITNRFIISWIAIKLKVKTIIDWKLSDILKDNFFYLEIFFL